MSKIITSKLKLMRSRLSLVAIYTFSIFMLILTTMSITAVIVLIQLKLGILQDTFYQKPQAEIIFAFAMSLIIGVVVTLLTSNLTLKLIREPLSAMKGLSSGNFNVRIQMNGLLRPKELIEFADEFNDMAHELGSIKMLRSDFVNNFSHEFKTPIISLCGFAKLLKKNNITLEERDEYLDIIISESGRLSELATNVLNLTKIENQTTITDRHNFDLSEQIRRAILMMESKWSKKGLTLDIDLKDLKFYGNSDLLSQVWSNVLDNAVKFSPQSGKLEVRLYDLSDSVAFSVQDCGCGMDQETQAHIFDKFYQGDMSRSTEGNGLGMAIVKKIVFLHGGQISVESEQGRVLLLL